MTITEGESIIKIRRATSSTWTSLNFLLEEGELGLELDTRKIKIGNGSVRWNSLPYSVKQVDNILFDGNSISATEGDLELRPSVEGHVFVYSDLFAEGDVYSQTSKKLATEEYVNSVKQALDVKDSVRVASTMSLVLAGLQTVDGIELSEGDRILVKNQNSMKENGIYSVSQGMWHRSDDADSNSEVTPGLFVFVDEGETNANSGWVLTSDLPISLGTSDIEFAQFSGAGQVVAGDGLVKSGNQINAVGTTDRILVGENSIDISPDYEGQVSITVLGVISAGSWRGETVEVSYGGTGFSEFALGDILYASGNEELSRLAAGSSHSFLKINSEGTAPEWSSVIDGGTP